MLLAVDIGNTNTKIALCTAGGDAVIATWRVSSLRERTPDEWYALLASLMRTEVRSGDEVTAVAVSSVVPSITNWFSEMSTQRLGVKTLVIRSDLDLGLRIGTDPPGETGVDRVVNGVAAFERYGGPVMVVDCGTATKFDVVSEAGVFLGGAIAPGLSISLDALTGRAARLYAVELEIPSRAIGTNTVASIQSGVVLGYLSLCEGLIARIQREVGGTAAVVVTGGAGELVSRAVAAVDHHEPSLTLDGIRSIYRRVKSTH